MSEQQMIIAELEHRLLTETDPNLKRGYEVMLSYIRLSCPGDIFVIAAYGWLMSERSLELLAKR